MSFLRTGDVSLTKPFDFDGDRDQDADLEFLTEFLSFGDTGNCKNFASNSKNDCDVMHELP